MEFAFQRGIELDENRFVIYGCVAGGTLWRDGDGFGDELKAEPARGLIYGHGSLF